MTLAAKAASVSGAPGINIFALSTNTFLCSDSDTKPIGYNKIAFFLLCIVFQIVVVVLMSSINGVRLYESCKMCVRYLPG